MAARSDGIGIEVTATSVRAVHICRGRPWRDSEALLPDDGSSEARLLEALVHLHETFDPPCDVPVRLAWFPTRAWLRATALGSGATPAPSSPAPLATRHASALTVAAGSRRWRLDLGWPDDEPTYIGELASRAGFRHVSVEPAPVALGRVGPAGTYLAERTVRGTGWTALVDGGVPLLAHADDDRNDSCDEDGLVLRAINHERSSAVVRPVDVAPSHEDVQAELDAILGEARARATGSIHVLTDMPLNARHVIALGAAAGAAGVAGRNRVMVAPFANGDTVGDVLPWAVERLATHSPTHQARPPSLPARLRAWWSRRVSALTRSGRPRGGLS